MMEMRDLVLFIMAQMVTAASVYAAIRADLREAMVRISILEKHQSSCK